MRRALLRPGWIISHVLVVMIAVVFVNLGLWQLRRLDERRTTNATIAARMATAPQPLDDMLARSSNDAQALHFRRVTVRGRYQPADEVLLTPRGRDGAAGHHLLTPLVLDDGDAILVERGWVPFALDQPPVAQAAPPSGEVTVTGLLQPTQEATRFGSFRGGARLEFMSVGDVDRVQPQTEVALLPFTLLALSQSPAPAELPRLPRPPDLTDGSHLSYALQWFAFTVVGLVGYPLLLRRKLRSVGVGALSQRRLDGPPSGPATERSTRNTSTTSTATTP